MAALAGAASSSAGIVILSVGSAALIAKCLVNVYENMCVPVWVQTQIFSLTHIS